MKKIFTLLTMTLLLSTPYPTHPKTLRTLVTLGIISIPGFHSYRAYKKASTENKEQPEMHALVALEEFAAKLLTQSAFAIKQAGLFVEKIAKEKKNELEKLELIKTNKKDQPETPKNEPSTLVSSTEEKEAQNLNKNNQDDQNK